MVLLRVRLLIVQRHQTPAFIITISLTQPQNTSA